MVSIDSMKGFSIIICAYNPKKEILERLFNAILKFESSSCEYEVIIIDNNSSPSLEQFEYVKYFLKSCLTSKIILEKEPGLTSARIAGIKAAKFDWLIFFDDDNEPAENYLLQANLLIEKYPKVGAWGPGKLNVNYINQSETTFLKKVKWLFQERSYEGTFFDNNMVEGSEYYPYGTGMIVKNDVLSAYVKNVKSGKYTMSDRKGKSLMSAGDIQILFTCLQMGYYAGSSSLLQLSHLIDTSKANPKYAAKLVYALNSSQLKAYQEVFPDRKQNSQRVRNYDVIKVTYLALRLYRLNQKSYTRKMYLSKRLGELNARVVAFEVQSPFLLKLFEVLINF